MTETQPYLGAQTYQEKDYKIFFGRQEETDVLLKLVKKNRLIVLFGKTGTGKSSLLNASLFPALRQNFFLPIYLRPEYRDNTSSSSIPKPTPVESTGKQLEKQLLDTLRDDAKDSTQLKFTYDPARKDNILEYIRRVKFLQGLVTPVLVFDQFEELFKFGFRTNYNEAHGLVDEIALLINTPESEAPPYKIILSLREDYIPRLEDLKKIIPQVMHTRFRLKKFVALKAFDAITKPQEGLVGAQTAIAIIKEIGTKNDDNYYELHENDEPWHQLTIDPIILSIYCYELDKLKKGSEMTSDLVLKNEAEQILQNYYLSAVGKNMKLRKAIEEKLIDESGKSKGIAKPVDNLCKEYKLKRDVFEEMDTKRRILKIENRDGIDYVEITHDLLAEQIGLCKVQRLKKEIRWRVVKISLITLAVVALVGGGIAYSSINIRALTEQNESLMKERDKLQEELKKNNSQVNYIVDSVLAKSDANDQLRVLTGELRKINSILESRNDELNTAIQERNKTIAELARAKEGSQTDSLLSKQVKRLEQEAERLKDDYDTKKMHYDIQIYDMDREIVGLRQLIKGECYAAGQVIMDFDNIFMKVRIVEKNFVSVFLKDFAKGTEMIKEYKKGEMISVVSKDRTRYEIIITGFDDYCSTSHTEENFVFLHCRFYPVIKQ